MSEHSEFIQKMATLMRDGKFVDVIRHSKSKIQTLKDGVINYKHKAELLNLIIDAAREYRGPNQNDIVTQLSYAITEYKKDRVMMEKHVVPADYNYCMGNAYDTMHEKYKADPSSNYGPDTIKKYSSKAKDYYWKSYKLLDEKMAESFRHHVIKSLGSSLSGSGRIVEAIQFYDSILKENSEHPFANGNRGSDLLSLKKISGIASVQMLMQVYQNWSVAATCYNIKNFAERYIPERNRLKKLFLDNGYDPETYENDKEVTEEEAEKHSQYWRFCLENILTLSEHAIYCNCKKGSKDNLVISISESLKKGKQTPKMEMLLNNIKAKYRMARKMYYSATVNDTDDIDVNFSEFGDNYISETNSELIKSSFISCFSVLDKIAQTFYEFNDLETSSDNVNFQNFLDAKNRRKWDKNNSFKNNLPLIALYSQATDLYSEDGEWSELKNWREAIEQNIFLLVKSVEECEKDTLGIYKWNKKPLIVEYSHFSEKCISLLKFVRASIFYLVFCLRSSV